jgi:hypothetical protein
MVYQKPSIIDATQIPANEQDVEEALTEDEPTGDWCPFGGNPTEAVECMRDQCQIWSKRHGKCSFTLEEEIIDAINNAVNKILNIKEKNKE